MHLLNTEGCLCEEETDLFDITKLLTKKVNDRPDEEQEKVQIGKKYYFRHTILLDLISI